MVLFCAWLTMVSGTGVGAESFSGGTASPSEAAALPNEARIPPVMDLGTALRIFRTTGVDLLIADAAVDGARGDERIAAAVANPAFSLGAGRTSGYDSSLCQGCSNVSFSAGVSDQAAVFDTLVGKRRLRVNVARAALEAAARSRADAERTGALAVEQQFLAVALAAAAREYAEQTSGATSETFRLVDLRYRKGAVSEAESALAEAAKLEAEQVVSQAGEAERQAKVTLAFLLGVRGPTPEFEVEREFSHFLLPGKLASANRESLQAAALSNRPDLKAQEAQRLRAEAGLALAKRQRFPDVDLALGYSQEGHGQSAIQPPTTTVGVSFALPLFYQQQGELAKTNADVRTQQLQLVKLQAQVNADVEGGFAAFTASRERAQRMEGRLLERARRARDLVKLQYEKGAASLLELLEAERSLIATQTEYLQDLSDYWTAVFQLEAAVGEELR
ncbi:MAG: TolC family protein [Thermoanaerobaculales bacterium]